MAVEAGAGRTRAWAPPATALECALVVALYAAGLAWTFRRWLFAGFDGIFGDDADGEVMLALLEHWRRVYAGTVWFADPTFFYPVPGALALSDTHFLYGTAYAAMRRLGADPFTAFMLPTAALSAIGFFGFVRLARRHFAIPLPWAAIGGFLFAFANMNAVNFIHAHNYTAMLLPLVCDAVLSAWRAESRGRAVALASAAGLLHAAILFSAFQTGWFFTAFLLLLAVLHPLVAGPARTRALVNDALTARRHVVLAYLAAFAIGLVPFAWLYGPVVLSGRHRTLAEVIASAPDARDIINVTTGNLLWGDLLHWLGVTGRPDRPIWEVELGFTPGVLMLLVGAGAVAAARLRRGDERDRRVLMLGGAVLVSFLVQLDYLGVRPWRLILDWVPGAGAIRYTFRSQIVANLFASIVIAQALAALAHSRFARPTALALALLLLAEQVNLDWPPTISRRETTAWLAAIPPAPSPCRVFYLAPRAEPVTRPGYAQQADAILFSQMRGMPTVNGYSSWFPDGWDLEEPVNAGYPAAVRAWVRDRGVEGLCGLDPGRHAWTIGLP
jgi:hypothetical protein